MALFPLVEYNRNDGAGVTIKLPDSVDLWSFLSFMDMKFMGITPEQLEKMRADDAAQEKMKPRAKGRKK